MPTEPQNQNNPSSNPAGSGQSGMGQSGSNQSGTGGIGDVGDSQSSTGKVGNNMVKDEPLAGKKQGSANDDSCSTSGSNAAQGGTGTNSNKSS